MKSSPSGSVEHLVNIQPYCKLWGTKEMPQPLPARPLQPAWEEGDAHENVGKNAKQPTVGAGNRGKNLGVEGKDFSAGQRGHMVNHTCLGDSEFSSLAEESLQKQEITEMTIVMVIVMIFCIYNRHQAQQTPREYDSMPGLIFSSGRPWAASTASSLLPVNQGLNY